MKKIKGSRPSSMSARARLIVDKLAELGITLKPVSGSHAWMMGRVPVYIRTSKLTVIPTHYGSGKNAKTYSYDAWHLNLDDTPDTIKKVILGLLDSKGLEVLAIVSAPTGKKAPKHSAIVRHKLSEEYGEILFNATAVAEKKPAKAKASKKAA